MSRGTNAKLEWGAVVGLPCFVVFVLNASFVWNHFAEGPYLHDAGWYSAIVWHSGLVPTNPPVAHPMHSYWSIHVSILVSLASVLSSLQPLGRVAWYAVFQGALFAPLGAFVGILARTASAPRTGRDVALFAVTAGLFAMNGQVIACMLFPHYEIFVATGICLMLAGFASGRSTLAWVGLACAVSTREDGGFHAATFACAALACGRLGRPFRVAERLLVRMIVVAVVAGVAAMVVQKVGFKAASLFRHEYIGTPAFHHLNTELVQRRLAALPDRAAFVVWPFAGAVAVAVVRRDARFLLGHAVQLPWFLLNFCAAQDLKADFSIYTGFPFVASIAWVGAYGAVAETDARFWARSLAFVSFLALLGRAFFDWTGMTLVARRALPEIGRAAPFEAVGRALERDRHAFGVVDVDPAIAAWAIRAIGTEERKHHASNIFSFAGKDGLLFTADGAWADELFLLLARSPFTQCGRAGNSLIYSCVRPESRLGAPFTPTSPLRDRLRADAGARALPDAAFEVDATPSTSIRVFGPYVRLPRGAYRAAWQLRWEECSEAPAETPRMRIDVAVEGRTIAATAVDDASSRPSLSFALDDSSTIELRSWSGRCGYVLEDIALTIDDADAKLSRAVQDAWMKLHRGEDAAARAEFETLLSGLEAIEERAAPAVTLLDRDSARAGLATVRARSKDCGGAVSALRRLSRRDQGSVAETPEVAACLPEGFWD